LDTPVAIGPISPEQSAKSPTPPETTAAPGNGNGGKADSSPLGKSTPEISPKTVTPPETAAVPGDRKEEKTDPGPVGQTNPNPRDKADLSSKEDFGGLSREEAAELDQQLRIAAAQSNIANMLGATARMAEQGLVRGMDPKNREQFQKQLEAISTMSPRQWIQYMKQLDISASTSSSSLASKEANQEAIHKYGIVDITRKQQRVEIKQFMANSLAGGITSGLRDTGLNPAAATQVSQIAAQAMCETLFNMSNQVRNDPMERKKALAKAAQDALSKQGITLSGEVLETLSATAYLSLENKVKTDKRTKQYKSVWGMISMHRGD
jgi:hypothetical protein